MQYAVHIQVRSRYASPTGFRSDEDQRFGRVVYQIDNFACLHACGGQSLQRDLIASTARQRCVARQANVGRCRRSVDGGPDARIVCLVHRIGDDSQRFVRPRALLSGFRILDA
jgi:hypothetical protein